MSLILGYANRNNAIIMSDGRAGINGNYSEHYNKTLKINGNIIIGFAGIKERIEHFLQHTLEQMGSDRENYYINDFLDMIAFFMADKETHKYLQSSFIIIGRDENNTMHTAIAGDSTDFVVKCNLVTTPRILSIGGTIDASVINNIYIENITKSDLSIISAMNKTISDVSLLDSSVNTNIFITTL